VNEGYNRFAADIEMMLGTPPSIFYKITWLGVTPVMLVCVIAFLGAQYVPAYYGNYNLPPYAEKIGWALALAPCALIPITMVFMFFYTAGNVQTLKGFFTDNAVRKDVLMRLVHPTDEWGPALPENFRRFSARNENGGLDAEAGEDDVFGGAELKAFKPKGADAEIAGEKDRLVHFQDEVKDKGEAGEPTATETAETKADDEAPKV